MRLPNSLDKDEATRPIAGLYRREAPRLSRYFRARLVSAEDTADLVQEVFVRFVNISAFTAATNPAAYLQRIARNLLFQRSRRSRAPKLVPLDVATDRDVATPPEQDHEIEAAELMQAYQDAVHALPPRTREVFLLHRIESMTYKAIATHLGISLRTVEWHMTEALVRLRCALARS